MRALGRIQSLQLLVCQVSLDMPSILITGASRGFGSELLDVYAGHGWTIFPLVRDHRVAIELGQIYPANCFPIVGDVSLDSVESAVERVLADHTESLDVLVNNAGHVVKNRGVLAASSAELIEHFNVHCVGAWRCVRVCLPYLRRSERPVVVNITSRFGSIGELGNQAMTSIYAYNIAKCAQNMLSACLDKELVESGIRVLPVHPGRLKTAAAAYDADTLPREAAVKLFDWIASIDESTPCEMYDLMRGQRLPW